MTFVTGSGGITLRGDMVESFLAHESDIPLDGVEGVTGSVRVRLKWEPQLLLRRKTHTTFMGTTRKMTTKMGTTAFNWSQPPKSTTMTSPDEPISTTKSLQTKLSNILESTSSSIAAVRTSNTSPQAHQLQQQRSRQIDATAGSHQPSIVNNTSSGDNHDFLVKATPGTVTVHVIEARGLRGDLDKLHPQVIVHLGKDQVLKTKKLKKTSTPTW